MLEDDLEVPLFNPPSQRVRRPPRSGPPEGGAAHRRRGPRRLRTPAAPARRAASSRSRRSSGSGSCPGSERFAAHLDAVEVALGKLEGLGRPTVHEPPMPLERVSRAQAGHPDPRQPLGLPRMSRNAPGSYRASRGRAKWLSRVRRQLSQSVRGQRVGDRGQLALHRPVDEPRRPPPPRRLALLGRAPVPPSYHRQGGGVMGRQPPPGVAKKDMPDLPGGAQSRLDRDRDALPPPYRLPIRVAADVSPRNDSFRSTRSDSRSASIASSSCRVYGAVTRAPPCVELHPSAP